VASITVAHYNLFLYLLIRHWFFFSHLIHQEKALIDGIWVRYEISLFHFLRTLRYVINNISNSMYVTLFEWVINLILWLDDQHMTFRYLIHITKKHISFYLCCFKYDSK
jgi:hypothetical protein